MKIGAVNCNNTAAADVVSRFANTNRTVVKARHTAAMKLPFVSFTLMLLRYIANVAAARTARIPIMLIALHGMNFMHNPPKLQHSEAAAMQRGPLKSDLSIRYST